MATWDEMMQRFGTTPQRKPLLAGLRRDLEALKEAGCVTAYVDGSFVTNKPVPGDFDACWEVKGVDLRVLDPILLQFDQKRQAQRSKFLGEFFPASSPADPVGKTFLEFFQIDKQTGTRKGIVKIDLRRLS